METSDVIILLIVCTIIIFTADTLIDPNDFGCQSIREKAWFVYGVVVGCSIMHFICF